MAKYKFHDMAPNEQVIISGQPRSWVDSAVQYVKRRYPERAYRVQARLDKALIVTRLADPAPPLSYVQAASDGTKLYGPCLRDEAVRVSAACAALIAAPVVIAPALGNEDGILNGVDLSGLCG